jgi:hypothetical protein
MTAFSAVLWINEEPERIKILRQIQAAMTPGQRSRLNSPISARQRVFAEIKKREAEQQPQPPAPPRPEPAPASKPAQPTDDRVAKLTAENAQLKAENARLKAELATKPSADDSLKVRIVQLEAELARAAGKPPPMPRPGELDWHRLAATEARKKAARAAAAAKHAAETKLDPNDPASLRDELGKLLTQLTAAKTQIRNQRKALNAVKNAPRGAVVMERHDRMTVVKCLHPDQLDPAIKEVFTAHPALAKQYEQACQIFNSLTDRKKVVEVP